MTTSSARSETYEPPPIVSPVDEYHLEVLREALVVLLEEDREQWRREIALIEAQAGKIIAELRAEVTVRLAALKDGAPGSTGATGEPGLQGIPGEPGPAGPPGPFGERGEPGATGEQGLQGEIGAPCPQGPQGELGPAGDRGLAGERGEIGAQGDPGEAGPPGPKGDTGAAGAPGDSGLPGAQGEPGARGEQGAAGPPGELGPAGQDGAPGLQGEQGERGDRGEVGEAGAPGAVGPDGIQGPQGDRGVDGEPGPQGMPGDVGERGADGAPGTPGRDGMLPGVRPWTRGVHYTADVLTHKGATWQALCDTGDEPPSDDWQCLAAAGQNGASLFVRGTYEDAATYAALDIVAKNGGSFIARKNNPGICPGPDWQLLTSPGKRGDKGERGTKGERGEPGMTPIIIGWKVDRTDFTATPVFDNGDTGAVLELRALFEQFQIEARA